MGSRVSYLPNADADRVIWLNNFAAKIATYAAVLGITSAEVTGMQKDAAFFQYIMNMLEAFKQYLNNIVSYKNLGKHAVLGQHLGALPVVPTLGTPPAQVAEGIFDRVSALVGRVKKSGSYTDAIGNDLGVIAPETLIDLNMLQPDLKIILDAGRPHLKWIKGVVDAIDLYADHNDGNGFVLIGRFMKNEYIDVTPLAQGKLLDEFKYKAICVIADEQVGLMSNVASVVVKKM